MLMACCMPMPKRFLYVFGTINRDIKRGYYVLNRPILFTIDKYKCPVTIM